MGPKKKRGGAAGDAGKGRSNTNSKGAAQVQLSAENERRLRRLLQNNNNTASGSSDVKNNGKGSTNDDAGNVARPPAAVSGSKNLSELQKKQASKRLLHIYEKLASEGFSIPQIERSILALPLEETTLEAVLDWLCFNLPGNELPKKFSSGYTLEETEGASVQLLFAAKEQDLVPTATTSYERSAKEKEVEITSRHCLVQEEAAEKELKAQQADWIRQYMAQQEEESESESCSPTNTDGDLDWEAWEDKKEKQRSNCSAAGVDLAASIVGKFQAAKEAAAFAKQKKNKQEQALYGNLIRELKQEMASLGLTEETCRVNLPGASIMSEPSNDTLNPVHTNDTSIGILNLSERESDDGCVIDQTIPGGGLEKLQMAEESKLEIEGDFVNLFDEDHAVTGDLPTSIIDIQKKERASAWAMKGNVLEKSQASKKKKNSNGPIKELMQRQPKALLQQHCQKHGWEVPKYERIFGEPTLYLYNVGIMRPSVGRGKAKHSGGLFTCCLPELQSGYKSVEEAQNTVATRALFQLFPDLPLYHTLPEPYRSMMLHWHMQGTEGNMEDELERTRRLAFIESRINICERHSEVIPVPDAAPVVGNFDYSENSQEVALLQPEYVKDGENLKSEEDRKSSILLQKFQGKSNGRKYKEMLESRAALPIATVKSEILQQMHNNNVLVISGETGSGKTTQVPQYIMEDMICHKSGALCNIICTQPRRLAAISIAQRVAEEQGDGPPGSSGSLIGYQVRLDKAWHHGTKLLFCTTGILLRRLAGDKDLSGVSHVIVDEVHERSVLGDFALIILKDLTERRQAAGQAPLKIILMSATVDATAFSQYFWNCPIVTVEGRTFPVENIYLEDTYEMLDYRLAPDSPAAVANAQTHSIQASKKLVNNSRRRQDLVQSGWGDETVLEEEARNPMFDEVLYHGYSDRTKKNLSRLNEDAIDFDLLEDLAVHIDQCGESGAILVFLPGMAEIHLLVERLSASQHFRGVASEWILPLHSSISANEQQRAFQRPPSGVRKVVVATNIAETSITIEDIVYVIDCGKHKEMQYDPRRGMSRMVETWISQANGKQRRGRAGRLRSGHCYCLYTKHRHDNLMRPFQIPEMLRVPLVELSLQIKYLKLGNIASILKKAMECPKVDAVDAAIATLHEVGALDKQEELTPLGCHLAKLPVDVRVGKMMIFGSVLGCLSPILTVAACLSYKSPFAGPQDQIAAAERAKQVSVASKDTNATYGNLSRGQQSDQLATVAAYSAWINVLKKRGSKAAFDYCKSNFLSVSTLTMLRDMRSQFGILLADIGFVNSPEGTTSKMSEVDRWIDDLAMPVNCNSNLASVIKATICAGLYPNVAKMNDESIKSGHAAALSRRAGLASSKKACWSDGRQEVWIHPSSVNHSLSEFHHPFLVYHEKVKTSRIFVRDTTVVSPYTLLLFGGVINIQHQSGQVFVDGWLKMNAPAQTAVLFKELRTALDHVLQEIMSNPQSTSFGPSKEVVSSIVRLLVDEENTKP